MIYLFTKKKTKQVHKKIESGNGKIKQTCERNGSIDGEDTCEAADVAERAVGVAREDFPAITAKEFDGLGVFVVVGLHESLESSRERESFGEEILVRERFKTLGSGFGEYL